jgi:hypothetical protein
LAATALAVLAGGGGGCGAQRAYSGPARPDAEVAIIQAKPYGIAVRAVDGRPVPSSLNGTVQVLPGAHVLSLEARWKNRCRQTLEMRVNVEAAQTYHLTMSERRPKPSPTDAFWEDTGEAFGLAAAPYLWPVVLPIVLIDPAPPSPPKEHELTVWLYREETGHPVAQWESHPGATAVPRKHRMQTIVMPDRAMCAAPVPEQ